jgi:23S rRNA (cytidine1920-2'-O)/16S rRNA (cytidine1409-2'-O)-methyltransferase
VPKRPRRLDRIVAEQSPETGSAEELIRAGRISVDGRIVDNPASLVRPGSAVTVSSTTPLRGEAKLNAALQIFGVQVEGACALDVGASAGGFTRALLAAGARRVYAVDAGHGQLIGSLRQDARVVNLESTNLAALDATVIPEPIQLVTIDVSYISLASAVPQLNRIVFAPAATLLALVKPMFELQLSHLPDDPELLEDARERALSGIEAAGWPVRQAIESPLRGSKGAVEYWILARRK